MGSFKNIIKKILLIRYSAIGDVVLATSMIELLRRNYPQSHLSMLLTPITAPIVEENPFLDRIIIHNRNKKKSYLKCIRLLREERFDLIASLQGKAGLLAFLAGAKYRAGFHNSLRYRWFYNLRPKKWYPEKHALYRYLNMVEPLNLEGEIPEPKIYLTKEEENAAGKLLQEKRISKEDFLIGFNPVSAYPAKEWLLKYYIQLGKELIERYNTKIIIFGKGDKRSSAICYNLEIGLAKPENVLSLAGKTSLRELAALAKCCRLFITGDTGPMHIAAAVGTKVLAFFGSTDPKKCGPVGKEHIILEDKKMNRMKNITPEKVLEEIDENFGYWLRKE